jgi:hypothetical protein
MRRIASLLSLFGLITVACHQGPNAATTTSMRSVITRDQIDSSDAHNVYELIVRLRPDFLRDRGSVSIQTNTHARAVVFMNDQEYGILETMRNIPTGRIGEVRYFSGNDAVARFGAQYGGGVVMLVSSEG